MKSIPFKKLLPLFVLLVLVILEITFAFLGSQQAIMPATFYKVLQIILPLALLAYGFWLVKHYQKEKVAATTQLLAWMDVSDDSIVIIDRNWQVINWNKSFQEFYHYIDIKKQVNLLEVLPKDLLVAWRNIAKRAFAGEKGTISIVPSETYPFNEIVFYPIIYNEEKNVVIMSKIPDDLGLQHKLIEEVQQRNEELKAQEEELRQNLEELQATQDEMLILQEELKDKEANLTALIDNLDDAMVSLDFKYKILSMNKQFIAYYENLDIPIKRGVNYLRTIPEDLANQRKAFIDKALEGNKFTVDEKFNKQFFEIHYNPIRSNEGLVIGVAIFAQNVTKYKESEQVKQKLINELEERTNILKDRETRLQASVEELRDLQAELLAKNEELQVREARVRSVIDNASDGILAVDKDYYITLINKPLQERYAEMGIDLDVGYNVFTMIPPEQIPHWKAICDKAMNGQTLNTIDKIRNRFFEVSLSPIYSNGNEIIGVAILTRDVSKQIKTAKKNNQTVDILKKIQERAISFTNQQDSTIEDYRKKVEQLKQELGKKS